MFTSKEAALQALGAFAPGAAVIAERLVYKTRAGTPNVNADFLGQRFLDTSTNNWYSAIAVGSGSPANDWKQDSN